MAEALMVCPEAPYPVAGGGPLRTACLLEYLASRYALDVIVFREPGAADPRDVFPAGLAREVRLVELPFHSRSAAARALRNVRRLTAGVPPLVDRFRGFDLRISKRYELAVVEHFWCAGYLPTLRAAARRVVLDLHNVESVLLERCAETEGAGGRWALRRFAAACRTFERKLLPQFDLLLVASETDREFAGGGLVWPNTLPFRTTPPAMKRNEVVFSGNMAYHPNAAAVRWCAEAIWPRIRAARPGTRWRLVGKNPESLRLRTDARIEIVGAVEDAVAELAPSRVAMVPLLSGSGTRFKILEAWAAGVPVVSTSVGAEGLRATDGEHLLIADDAESFAKAVVAVLNDDWLAGRLATAGRALYEERYTWPVAWKTLEAAGL